MNKKFWMIGAGALVVLAIIGYSARGMLLPQASTLTPTPETEPAVAPLVADARVVPVRAAALSLPVGGDVAQVPVREGDAVQADQLLVQLEQDHELARVASAETALTEAEASYEKLLAGATAEDIAIAEAQLRLAQAQQRQVESSVTTQDIRAAEAQVSQARTQLTQLAAGPKDVDRRTMDAQLSQAQENLNIQRDQLSANKTAAELRLKQATEALTQAQTRYSTALWNWQELDRTGRDPINPTVPNPANPAVTTGNTLNDAQKQQYKDALVSAEADLHRTEQVVQEALVAYNTARATEISGVQAAEQQIAQAQAGRDRVMEGAGPEAWAAAQAALAGGQAQLAKLNGNERKYADEAAHAAVNVAQANLARLQAPASESELALARARIQSARAELDQAQLALADTELRAPFAGVVAALDLRENEYVASGAPVVQLADLSTWKIETTDLTELNIEQVRVGAPVTVTFDALPGAELAGRVTHITPFGEVKQGDITYTAEIELSRPDPRMRWNMTATVTIMP